MSHSYLILVIISLGFIITITPAYSQAQDNTIAGIIVPKFTSTQNQYCSNGHCGTGGTPPIPVNYTTSTTKYHVLLISLSQTCEILDKNNMTGCPPIKDLMKYDTSNKLVSGIFVKHGDVYIRTPPQMKNNWLAYTYVKNTVICVECYFDGTATSKSQEIIIQPSSFSFVNKTESENNNKFYNFANRYMQGCDVATISNVPGLLDDTIYFMLHGCMSSATSFKDTMNNTRVLKPFSFENPYSTLHQLSYLGTIFHGHVSSNTNMTSGGTGPVNCITHQCNFKDPYAKQGY